MKKLITAGAAFTLALLLLSGCSMSDQNTSPTTNGDESKNIIATVDAPEGSLAGLETNPINYLKPKYDQIVIGAVEGEITNVDYSTMNLIAGVDVNTDVYVAVNIMTISVSSSTFDAPTEIKVATSGGYLSPEVEGVYGKPAENLGADGVIEYRTAGGAQPPVVGEKVVLYLQESSGAFAKMAPYFVIGSSYGRFTFDSTSGQFTRKMNSSGDSATFSKKELAGDLLKTR